MCMKPDFLSKLLKEPDGFSEYEKFLIYYREWRLEKCIRRQKGQNSVKTWRRGCLVLESRCCGFSVLESRYRGFMSSEKCLGITISWLSCLRFSMSWCFSPQISMSWFFGLGISMSRFFGLEISMSWYMCLHGLVFVFTKFILPHK